ncbi:MAG: iron-containing alcohol dehydrogenase [Anaerolineae bacterium]|nr:MAG: iron-containing alcohol dehydrogenase [Anaerolineae bacterium]
MRGEWRFHTAGEIIFGRGSAGRVGETVRRLGAQRVLLVTDPGLVAAGLHEGVEGSLAEAGVAMDRFDGGLAKPTLDAVAACVATAQGKEYGALVALGGGSNIDLAKAAAVVLSYGGSAEAYWGQDQVPGPVLPLVAVSTTAGTGSEVSAASVLADPARKRRGAILSNYLRPRVAIYDPLLTVSCPRQVTADAGIDALTHAVEAYMVVDYRTGTGADEAAGLYQGRFPLSDLLAEQAIALAGRYLRRAVYQEADLEAREGMHLASLLAGMSFSNAGLTAVHALEYPIGVLTGCTHGAGNGLLLPYVMAYNVPACPGQLATVAQLLGEEVDGLSVWQAAERAVEAVQRLKAEVGIPMTLRDLGVQEADLRPLAEATAQITRLLRANPRPLDADSLEGILRQAW